jgi:hypothetical protein
MAAICTWTAGQTRLQLGQAAAGLGQGLVQAAGLLGVQVRRMGEHRAAGHAERGDGGVDETQPGVAVGVHGPVVAGRDRQQPRVIRGRQ